MCFRTAGWAERMCWRPAIRFLKPFAAWAILTLSYAAGRPPTGIRLRSDRRLPSIWAFPTPAWVGRLEAVGDGVDAEQHLQDVIETVHMPFPCLVTVEQDICMPRLPSLKTARETAQRVVHIQGLDSFLDTDPDHYGLTGSPTQVERIFPPQSEVEHEIWEDAQAPKRLYTQLKKWKFI